MTTNPVNQDEQIMSLDECAKFLGQSQRTIAKWKRDNGLPYAQVDGGKIIFMKSKVMKWLDGFTRNGGVV